MTQLRPIRKQGIKDLFNPTDEEIKVIIARVKNFSLPIEIMDVLAMLPKSAYRDAMLALTEVAKTGQRQTVRKSVYPTYKLAEDHVIEHLEKVIEESLTNSANKTGRPKPEEPFSFDAWRKMNNLL